MKIKNTDITVTMAQPDLRGRSLVVRAVRHKDENRIRAYYHRALSGAAKQKKESITFIVDGKDQSPAGLKACAKILAQEIFRLLHEDKNSLRRITVCAKGKAACASCKKNTLGYLDYIHNKLKSPYLTVDAIIEYRGGIVLIKRSNPPFGWAIPGGFVDYGESLEDAARREVKEETNLEISGLKQLHTYSDPSRDPRFHTVTTVFCAKGKGNAVAGDDAAGICVVSPGQITGMECAFNHKDVLIDYLKFKAGKDPY